MKILHLITRMDGGGSAVNTLLTATKQVEAGHGVKLVFGQSDESAMSDAEKSKVVEGLEAFRKLGGHTQVVSSLKRELGWHDRQAIDDLRIIMLQGFDVLHTHTSKAGALGRLAVRSLAMKVIHTPHGHIFHGYFGGLKTQIFLQVERYLAKKTDILLALTQAERDDHLALGVGLAEQWRVVPSGVNIDKIKAWMWQHPVTEKNKCWDAVSVGRLVPIKGMDRLIRAWALVVQAKPDARLAIVGDGEDREMLEKLATELDILSNVAFVGWADPLPYLGKAKVFTLLSHNEGMGRAVVEAMAAGLPSVVSNVCGLKELVTAEVGCCLDADDAQAVAHALLQDWDAGVSRQARARAGNYAIESMMNALDLAYEDVS